MSDPPIVQTAETFPIVASGIQPTRFDDNARRRSSMQEAADTIMWDTFDLPGVASQAMLPPQPSRAYSQGQRTSSIGQPLQLMDSKQSLLPYTGKGKGRARDFDPNQQQQQVSTGWDPTTVANFGQLSVPYVEDVQPFAQQPQIVDPGTFTFAQEQFTPWQPLHPDYAQSSLQQVSFNPQAQEFQPVQPQGHSHAHPHPVQARSDYPVQGGPAPPLQQFPQMPMQQLYQPPPTFPQYPQNPGLFLHPGNQPAPQQQQHWLDRPPAPTNAQATNSQQQQQQQQQPSLTQFRVGVGYRFRPGLGFVCQVCGTVLQQPNMHFDGRGRWCEAAGTEMSEQLNIMEDIRRRRREPYV